MDSPYMVMVHGLARTGLDLPWTISEAGALEVDLEEVMAECVQAFLHALDRQAFKRLGAPARDAIVDAALIMAVNDIAKWVERNPEWPFELDVDAIAGMVGRGFNERNAEYVNADLLPETSDGGGIYFSDSLGYLLGLKLSPNTTLPFTLSVDISRAYEAVWLKYGLERVLQMEAAKRLGGQP